MWLLEADGDVFNGKRLWLRPGKTYLFGRTSNGVGEYVVFDKTISRKHLTIRVDPVAEGEGRNLRSRSQITLHDLDTKKGTLVNDVQIRGRDYALTQDHNVIRMATKTLRVIWQPVIFSFSFTGKELRNDPWAKLREDLEQLDIKYSAEYHNVTSHVVSKKRNTSKGLQALISGKFIVTDSFTTAVVQAATTGDGEEAGAVSALEGDYDGNWPNPLDHLPPRGEEPSDRPAEAYSPDERRREVFDGYTFVFYEKKQYDNLFPVVTTGKGKAVLKEVFSGEADLDDFIGYVKGLAGEKGLGSFEDGSEGRGVVLVRYLPAKGADFDWYAEFLTSVALRLDHRPIDQREFLEAILACDATMLRRPLEEESQSQMHARSQPPVGTGNDGERMEVDRPAPSSQTEPQAATQSAPSPSTAATQRVRRPRRAVGSRFKGFDLDSDDDAAAAMDEPPSSLTLPATQHTQQQRPETQPSQRQRKRPHSPVVEETPAEIMDELAPTAAAVKRRRIELGETPIPATVPEAEADHAMDGDEEEEDATPAKGKSGVKGKKKVKREPDILELARQHREEEEKRAAAEKEALNALPDDGVDYAAIRRMHIVEEIEVRSPQNNRRDADGAGGGDRWNPRWNGRPNFKRFRKQGQQNAGRPAQRVIVSLQEVKAKEYGIGDDYWLEDESAAAGKKRDSQRETQQVETQTQTQKSKGKGKENGKIATARRAFVVDSSDEEEDEELGDASEMPDTQAPVAETQEPARTRTAKAAEKAVTTRRGAAQAETQTQTRAGKRTATAPPAKEKPGKKPRRGAAEVQDSEESDEEPRFRFGRR
ncbi:hypothetical protein GE09DRAFT_6274 [Coniochaeta sp. 2T2.1]|nr:hypothetical protein GE09DRAFT_6274 [Coniochaeta sp. 2T2.1]